MANQFLTVLSQAILPKALSPVADNRGWYPLIKEPFTGAWQRNLEIDQTSTLSYHAIFACLTLISSDISKLRVKLVQQDANGIWTETTNSAYSPVLRKPNETQNRIQFWENWMLSKLIRGNTYVLKERDNRKVVVALYILDPQRVRPLVSDDGSIFYRLGKDNYTGVTEDDNIVPAREIIHDRWHCLFHPLCGISPLYASSLSATQGSRIQNNSVSFFGNASNPGGILTAPGRISQDSAEEMKSRWEANYGGNNIGRVAVLGDGLTFEKISITAVDAQLIEQLRYTAENVCSTFHVPPYKIGVGTMPSYNNIQALNIEYYSQCLQVLIEAAELCMAEGLELGTNLGVSFDEDGLLRMDSITMADLVSKLVHGGVLKPNDGRRYFDLPPTEGGDVVYLQEQNYSLPALAKRDALDNPFGAKTPTAASAPSTPSPLGKVLLEDAIAAIYYRLNRKNGSSPSL